MRVWSVVKSRGAKAERGEGARCLGRPRAHRGRASTVWTEAGGALNTDSFVRIQPRFIRRSGTSDLRKWKFVRLCKKSAQCNV